MLPVKQMMARNSFRVIPDPDRIIQGGMLRFVDGQYSDRDKIEVPLGTQLIGMGTALVIQRWEDQELIEKFVEPLPNLEELNDAVPESEWETGLDGKPRKSYALCYVIYLLNAEIGDIFTMINSTTGQRICFEELESRVMWIRQLRGHGVVPLVELGHKQMKTAFGRKLRPHLKVLKYLQAEGTAIGADTTPAIEHKPEPPTEGYPDNYPEKGRVSSKPLKEVKEPSLREDLGDGLPDDDPNFDNSKPRPKGS